MVTLTSIATKAFNAVASKIDGAIKPFQIIRTVRGATYDPVAGKYPETTQQTTGRGVQETDKISEKASDFPGYVMTGKETLWFIAEMGFAPEATDKFVVDGVTYDVKAVRDILGNKELFRVLVI